MISAGAKLGRYEVRSLIGAGGMGEVYLAHDPKIGRDVAIKVLPNAFSSDRERLSRFEQEAQAAGALNHPNVLAIYDVDTHEGAPYVVSELLEGETLREAMNGSAMPVRKAVDWARQVAHGLGAAHEKGIIHRDLKPENLFITTDGRIKILDFGLAKLTETNGDLAGTDLPTRRVNTDSGAVMGTVGYMSPEQLRGKPVDPRTDIFSFGTVLYEMLSGQKAFYRDSTADTISAILREDPPELSSTNKDVNAALDRVVRRCLEKNREQRFHSASDLAFALESLTEVPASAEATRAVATATEEVPTGPGKIGWIGWAAAAVLLSLLAGSGFLYWRQEPVRLGVMKFALPAPEKTTFGDSMALSPDGRQIVFTVLSGSGTNSLWVRAVDAVDARQLPGTDGAAFPFWSPDSRHIGFFAAGKLKKMDAAGGPVESLADAAADPRGATWGPDGTILFAPNVATPLLRISASGGPAMPATELDASRFQNSHRWPAFLPDGRHFIFFGRGTKRDLEGIFVGSLDSPEVKFLMRTEVRAEFAASAAGSSDGYILFIRERSLLAQPFDTKRWELKGEPASIADEVLNFPTEVGPTAYGAFSASQNGHVVYRQGGTQATQLTWVDQGGRTQEVLTDPGLFHEPQLSPDGKKLLFSREDAGTQDLTVLDLARGTSTRMTFDPAIESSPVWSPDGTSIVFSSTRRGHFELYQKPASGAGSDELILATDGSAFADDWSNDGKYIIFEVDGGMNTKFDLWVLPMTGDRQPQPFLKTEFQESHAQFSPDGRWVAYVSDESGRAEIYVQTFPATGGKWQISTSGGDQPQWSGDGKQLFYLAPDRNVNSVPISTGAAFEAGRPEVVFATRVPLTALTDDRNNYLVAPDNRRFLVNNLADENSGRPLILILNWASALKR